MEHWHVLFHRVPFTVLWNNRNHPTKNCTSWPTEGAVVLWIKVDLEQNPVEHLCSWMGGFFLEVLPVEYHFKWSVPDFDALLCVVAYKQTNKQTNNFRCQLDILGFFVRIVRPSLVFIIGDDNRMFFILQTTWKIKFYQCKCFCFDYRRDFSSILFEQRKYYKLQ